MEFADVRTKNRNGRGCDARNPEGVSERVRTNLGKPEHHFLREARNPIERESRWDPSPFVATRALNLDFLTTEPMNNTCPTNTTPIYRAYNNGFSKSIDSNHRITSDQTAIQEVVARGWINEGVVMCAPQ